MKFLLIFQFIACLSLHASSYSQRTVNLDMKNISLDLLFKELGKQTRRDFLYSHSLIKTKGTVNVKAEDKAIEQVLDEILPALGLEYILDENVVIIRERYTSPQQNVRITGKITDEKNSPLPGVTVTLKGLKMGTATDIKGDYSITLPRTENITIVFSFVGMETREIKYTGKNVIDVVLKESVSQLEEVIVRTGYQNIDLRTTTSAIQSIKAEDIVVPGLQSIDQMLEGYVPGMVFMQNSGQVGAAPRLRVRGTSTILASQEPLWVIDGIVQQNPVNVDPERINDLDFVNLLGNAITGLNPDDIAQIDILKDASATALYGARAANGVIVVTTKQGKQGPPSLSYSMSGTFTRRPYYSDPDVNMMNSAERVALSRETMEKRVAYPKLNAWIGYERIMRDYWQNLISYEEMEREVSYYESLNTDWFDLLMQNTFSNKHTLSLSGGGEGLRYYVSAGMSDTKGSIRGEELKQYTANINLSAVFNRWNIQFNLTGNVDNKNYTPTDVEVTKYAYETTRALPAYNDDGSLWYYGKGIYPEYGGGYKPYSIINEMENSSQDVRASGITATTSVRYSISEALKASVTASYSTNNTTQEIWHGENTFYAEKLRMYYAGDWNFYNYLPAGGELQYQNTERYAYTVRGQLDFNHYMDRDKKHLIDASAGGEISSNQYLGMKRTFRGYLKERGKKSAEINLANYPDYGTWLSQNEEALGVWTDNLSNTLSGYATLSYTYNNLYTVNVNARMDASNLFGSRANENLAPIWSFSARWDTKNDILKDVNWINAFTVRGSFGYQGNMLDNISAKLILQRGGIDANFNDYESTVKSYPNPDLKWEKTGSYNVTADFSLFNNKIGGSISYFYKKTENVFVNKTISSINGVDTWTVNQGELENKGVEIGVRITPINFRSNDPNGFYWSITPNIGQILNKMLSKQRRTDKTLINDITYAGLLQGTYEVEGRPLNSFFSYQFQGLDINNGLPIFYGSQRRQYVPSAGKTVDLFARYGEMSLDEVFMDFMSYSGTRIPKVQGGIQNSLGWGRFSMSFNLTYSFGSKIRLLQMYPDVSSLTGSIAPQPEANVRREFLDVWRKPGDEFHTKVPAIVSSALYTTTLSGQMWWIKDGPRTKDGEDIRPANDLWQMYDNSDLRVVSGDFVKLQSLSVRYNFTDKFCNQLKIRSAYIGLSGTNLHTFCNKRLKGQDPATQSGAAPTINMSLRPTYSFNLNVSF